MTVLFFLEGIAPIINEQHWWCYAINCQTRQFFVLDSLGRTQHGRKRINNAIVSLLLKIIAVIVKFNHSLLKCMLKFCIGFFKARNMEILFGLLLNVPDGDKPKFEVLTQDPLQPNL